jgi:hypothetical protein
MKTKLSIQKLNHLNTLVIKQEGGKDFFVSTKDSIIISIPQLSRLLLFLLKLEFLSPKVLEGVLEELNTSEPRR